MYTLNSEITINGTILRFATEITIESSWNTFTDTAVIELPDLFNKTITSKTIYARFPVGSEVTIKLGYFPNLNTVFNGFVTGITSGKRAKIECRDHMWM